MTPRSGTGESFKDLRTHTSKRIVLTRLPSSDGPDGEDKDCRKAEDSPCGSFLWLFEGRIIFKK